MQLDEQGWSLMQQMTFSWLLEEATLLNPSSHRHGHGPIEESGLEKVQFLCLR